jgi:hypothetical protein
MELQTPHAATRDAMAGWWPSRYGAEGPAGLGLPQVVTRGLLLDVAAARGGALAGWLADHRVALTGCDTWSFGPYPAESPDAAPPASTRRGPNR